MADNKSTPVYDGGIPNQGFNGTFPSSAGSETMYKPNAGPAEQTASNGGPVSGANKSDNGGFVKDAGVAYEGPGDIEPGAMNVIDLSDIKSTV